MNINLQTTNKYIYPIFVILAFLIAFLTVKNNLNNIKLRYRLDKKQLMVKREIIKYDEALVKYQRVFLPKNIENIAQKQGLDFKNPNFISIHTLNNLIATDKVNQKNKGNIVKR